MNYGNIENALVAWFTANPTFTGVRVCTELPAELEANLPLIRLVRVGGTDKQPTIDAPNIDIECFALDRTAAHDLAEQVRTAVRTQLPNDTSCAVLVNAAATASAPVWRPFDDTNVRRFGAIYQLHTRATSA